MAAQENAAIVRRLYEKFEKGDIDAMLGGMAEDVKWQLPEIAEVPLSGKRQGHNGVREFFASLAEMQDVQEMQIDHMVAEGDTVVVLGRYSWRVKATDRSFSSDFAHVFHLAGGKIEKFQKFLDTAAVAAAHQAR
ncbi:MAG: nuclear transport factor 2 family protein [Acidobacteria bacterium]|nr:nuclear transport factor 2 family protein [Acidobacteriota bacterium]